MFPEGKADSSGESVRLSMPGLYFYQKSGFSIATNLN